MKPASFQNSLIADAVTLMRRTNAECRFRASVSLSDKSRGRRDPVNPAIHFTALRQRPNIGGLDSKVVLPYIDSMTTLTITSKGQVTLRKDVLEHLGVEPGQQVSVDKLPDGRIEVRAAPASSVSALFGLLKRKGGPVLSIEEMNAISREGWAGARKRKS